MTKQYTAEEYKENEKIYLKIKQEILGFVNVLRKSKPELAELCDKHMVFDDVAHTFMWSEKGSKMPPELWKALAEI